MVIIKKSVLNSFGAKCPDAIPSLNEWYAKVKAADWKNHAEDDGDAMGTFNAPPLIVDWRPAVNALLDDVSGGVPLGVTSARWHNTMADIIAGVARSVGRTRVVLSGGCFQNAALCERADWRLRAAGFQPYWHQRVPPNDGGIALGQLAAVIRDHRGRIQTEERRSTCA